MMATRPRKQAKRFTVWSLPNASDVAGEAHFAVSGPRVDEFDECERYALTMQRALNTGPQDDVRRGVKKV